MSANIKGEILIHQEVAPKHMYLVVKAPGIARQALPGQFIQVKCSDTLYPLLRRPISLHEIHPAEETISFLYQVKGKGTQLLAQKEQGTKLDLLGPLGTGFSLEQTSKRVVVIGGGIGVAPLLPLLVELKDKNIEVLTMLGFNSKEQLLRLEEFQKYPTELIVTTLDGSYGRKGLVTAPLAEKLQEKDVDLIYSCGPEPMLKAVVDLALANKVPSQVSLEAHMACGIGACLGCVCGQKAADKVKYVRVCMEGPVFPGEEVAW